MGKVSVITLCILWSAIIGIRDANAVPPLNPAMNWLQFPALRFHVDTTKFTVTTYLRYADLYRTGALETHSASFSRDIGIAASYRTKWGWLQAARIDKLTHFGFDEWEKSLAVVWVESKKVSQVESGIRYRDYTAVMGVSAVESQSRPKLSGALRYTSRWVCGEFAWSSDRRQSTVIADWQGNNGSLDWLQQIETWKVQIRTKPIKSFQLIANFERQIWIRPNGEFAIPTIEPWGKCETYSGTLAYGISKVTSITANVRGGFANAIAYGMYAELPFAKFTNLSSRSFTYEAGVLTHYAGHSIRAAVERSRWNTYWRGHVEFWPFSSGFSDLLGARRYFLSSSAGYWWRYRIASDWRPSNKIVLQVGASVIDLYPEAWLTHWKPEFLVFGKTDEQATQLEIFRIQVGCVDAAVNWKIDPSWSLEYRLRQYFPLRTWKFSQPSTPATGETSPAKRSYGGGFHSIVVRYCF